MSNTVVIAYRMPDGSFGSPKVISESALEAHEAKGFEAFDDMDSFRAAVEDGQLEDEDPTDDGEFD